MRNKVAIGLVGATVVALLTLGLALAWPDQPPARATISGPGLPGEVEITDPAALTALRLGVVEDLGRGPIAAPSVSGPGYAITRYFDDGSFNFAHLRYYPGAAGQPGYLFWEDGRALEGQPTRYDNRWLRATVQGDQALRGLLLGLGVNLSQDSGEVQTQAAPAAPLAPAASRLDYLLVLVAALGLGGLALARLGTPAPLAGVETRSVRPETDR